MNEADRIVRENADVELALSWAFARLRVEAARAAADLLSAANDHLRMHAVSPPILAALDASEALARIAKDGVPPLDYATSETTSSA